MRSFIMAGGLVAGVFGFGLGCSVDEPAPEGEEPTSADAQEIVGGALDTDDYAVAYIVGAGECTATIVGVSGDTGYALTAAHCIKGCNEPDSPPEELWLGDTIYGPTGPAADSYHPVTSFAVHPNYDGCAITSGYDYAMITFSGANALMPTIPPLSPEEDMLAVGSEVEHVGYGLYNNAACPPTHQAGYPGLCFSDVRRTVTGVIGAIDAISFSYDQNWAGPAAGGPCNGDSGGPALVQTAGGKRIAGLTSYGDEACDVDGVSARASVAYNDFIVPFMNGVPLGPPACNDCQAASTSIGSCGDAQAACAADPNCTSLDACVQACADEACMADCGTQFPDAKPTYEATLSCVCSTDCAASCGTDARCAGGGVLPEPAPSGNNGGGNKDDDGGSNATCSASPGYGSAPGSILLGAAALGLALMRRRRR